MCVCVHVLPCASVHVLPCVFDKRAGGQFTNQSHSVLRGSPQGAYYRCFNNTAYVLRLTYVHRECSPYWERVYNLIQYNSPTINPITVKLIMFSVCASQAVRELFIHDYYFKDGHSWCCLWGSCLRSAVCKMNKSWIIRVSEEAVLLAGSALASSHWS